MGTQVAQMITGTPQPAASPHSEQSTAERLQVLESLREGGAITEAEYTRKRERSSLNYDGP